MRVFNLAEELEKERKKNKELEERIDKAVEIIEKHKDYKDEGLLVEETIKLLNILRGNNE